MATKKTVSKKPAQQKTLSAAAEDVTNQVQEAATAGLGLYGKVYDEVQDRVAQLRKDAPKQWDTYVKRGEKLQKDINKKIDSSEFSINVDMKEKREQLQTVVDKMKDLLTPAAAA
ncbi:MAG: hypothetical protein ACR2P1_20315 [Pseudomonadales bacterium]